MQVFTKSLILTLLLSMLLGKAVNATEALPEVGSLNQHELVEQAYQLLAPPIDYEFNQMKRWLQQALALAQQNNWHSAQYSIAAPLTSLLADLNQHENAAALLERYPLSGQPEHDFWLINATLNIVSAKGDISATNLAIEQAIKISKGLQSWQRGQLWFGVGRAYYQLKQFDKSLVYMSKAQADFEPNKSSLYLAQIDSLVANIHYSLGDYQTAQNAYLKLLKLSQEREKPYNEASVLYALGRISYHLQQWQQAEDYMARSAKVALQATGFDLYGLAQSRLAQLELDNGQYQQAELRLEQLINVWLPQQQLTATIGTRLFYLEALIGLGRYDRAEELYNRLDNELTDDELSNEHVTLAKLGYQLAKRVADPQLEYQRLKQFTELDLGFIEQERTQAAGWLAIKEEAETLRSARKSLEKQSEQQQLAFDSANQDTVLLQLIGVVIGLLTIGSLVMWYRSNSVKQQMEKLAYEDYLTGALNRRAILNRAAKALKKAERQKKPLLIGCIDLDHFKRINDGFGHDVGDRLLQAFSLICKQHLRHGDQFGRIGGEEWLLVLPNTSTEQANDIFYRLQYAWKQASATGFDHSLPLTFSMGAVEANGQPLHDVMRQADEQLYLAKKRGRDQFVAK